jgi:hypothetical protein
MPAETHRAAGVSAAGPTLVPRPAGFPQGLQRVGRLLFRDARRRGDLYSILAPLFVEGGKHLGPKGCRHRASLRTARRLETTRSPFSNSSNAEPIRPVTTMRQERPYSSARRGLLRQQYRCVSGGVAAVRS